MFSFAQTSLKGNNEGDKGFKTRGRQGDGSSVSNLRRRIIFIGRDVARRVAKNNERQINGVKLRFAAVRN